MKFLEEYGFLKEDIKEYDDNTPKKIKNKISKHLDLVKSNLNFISKLGIDTYKEIFISYPDMFLMDNSNFEEMFNKYETDELIEKLNANYKMVEYL